MHPSRTREALTFTPSNIGLDQTVADSEQNSHTDPCLTFILVYANLPLLV